MVVDPAKQPFVVLLGLQTVPDLGSAPVGCGVVILDDLKQYRAREANGGFEVVVFEEAAAFADELVEEIRAREGAAIMIADSDAQRAFARVLELGADAFLCQPVDGGQLARVAAQEIRAVRRHPKRQGQPVPVTRFVGRSQSISDVCAQLGFMAPSNAPVLITGESGTGKDLVARALHRLSPRRRQSMIAVNCGAIPSDLIESQLFGHEKGAFTGADGRQLGCFEAADGGTLFLDEIGELAADVQVKLLRALQDGGITRVGGTQRIQVDVRIIAATNSDLAGDLVSGAFREDLYYRLNVLHLHLPALRERRSDVQMLWEHFVETAALEEGTEPPETTDDVLEVLEVHDWPGNVRELENTARRAVALRPARSLTPLALPSQLRGPVRIDEDEIRIPGMTLDDLERVAIRKTYDATGSVKRTAEILGVSERKIFYRLKQYREAESEGAFDDRTHLALVEDDGDLRVAMRELLSRSYLVSEFASVEELLNSLAVELPDVIVTDVRMPNQTGLDLLDELHERHIEVPVILMSAYADAETRSKGFAKGALAFLEKPIDAISLGRHLERAMSPAPG